MLNVLAVSFQAVPERLQRAQASLVRQGFIEAVRFDRRDVSLSGWTTADADREDGHAESVAHVEDGFACCVGPLWYRGSFGRRALLRLLEDIAPPSLDERERIAADRLPGRIDPSQIRGSHAVFIQHGCSAWLWNDAPGFVHVFRTGDGRFHSTSWLAARAYSDDPEIDEDAAIEYVLLGASHSEQTVAVGVQRLPTGHAADVRECRLHRWLPPHAWRTDTPARSENEAVDSISSHLRTVFGEIASAFPGRTRVALSGGFDSRLIVAGLLDQGERPDLFVYGKSDSPDAVIAMKVAQAESLRLSVIDKSDIDSRLRKPDLDDLVSSAQFFDGLPNDGIIDPGADRRTRIDQSGNGFIALNGGGGEIFRNYFHLPDRPFLPISVVRAFYRQFDARCLLGRTGLRRYEDRLASSIARSVGGAGTDGRLSRGQVERVYALFRCHYWMGVNNGIAQRSGYFTTPLVDLELVRMASEVPLRWKNAGRLESRLIARLHADIAKHPSNYGFAFSEGPDARARRREWAMCSRPIFARPMISAIRQKLHGGGKSGDAIRPYRALLKGEWRLDRVLDHTRLPDDEAVGRALSVELLVRGLVD